MKPLGFSRATRRAHMYLALFLTPWMLGYGFSTALMNHLPWVRNAYGGQLPRFEEERTLDYSREFAPGTVSANAGRMILEDLGLDGSHFVGGNIEGERLRITRNGPFVQRRITYHPATQTVRIEKRAFSLPTFLMGLHTRSGYRQPYLATDAWAVVVDLVVLAMVFWVLSGLWMWWEIRPARRLGAALAVGGLGLFLLFLFTI